MRILTYFLLAVCLAGGVWAKPVADRVVEAKGFLLEKKEVPALKMSFERPMEWYYKKSENDKSVYVISMMQRWWRPLDQMELIVEAGIFPSQEDALKAAELRVRELKERKNLQEQVLKGGQLPGQAKGDRAWGLWDPPEPNKPPDHCRNIGPISRFAAVVFVKKEVCIQITAACMTADVSLDDLEQLAKKIAVKIKPANEPPGQKDKKK